MTDEQIAEIYALARESFFGGQKSFQLQAFPFRMTPLNMARHRNSPHFEFWKMLKQGNDHFEVTHLEPQVNVCENRYVFNALSLTQFSATERCPAYKVPEYIAAAVRDKQRRDDIQIAELISRGTPIAHATTGIDGGMNLTFLAAVKSHGGPGATIRTASGTIPAHVSRRLGRPKRVPAASLIFRNPSPRPARRCMRMLTKPSAALRSEQMVRSSNHGADPVSGVKKRLGDTVQNRLLQRLDHVANETLDLSSRFGGHGIHSRGAGALLFRATKWVRT